MACLVFRSCENSPEILREVCLERGWKEYEDDDGEDDWNLWWKSSGFRTSDFESCRPWQRLNHFPKSNSITRKDCLARNLRRMKGVYGNILYNFAPLSFNLPNDYRKFVTEYSKDKENRKSFWICKPAYLSRGKGIFLFRNLTDLTYDCATVVQEYIQNPFLIAGYKFDLRLYVLVTSFHPLHIYLYHEGLARFGTEKFDLNCLDNLYSHLTNASINKQSPSYAADKERIGSGCKWSLGQLRTYFHQHDVDDLLLWHKITAIVILTLLMQAPEVQQSTTNCFEIFGFDVLIDANLKPWLLEVNFSPSLGIDCSLDIIIKKALLQDTLDVINLKESDISACTLKNCITRINGSQKESSPTRAKSKLASQYSIRPKVDTSSRFYTRSRLSQISSVVNSRMSKESSESATTDTLLCSDEFSSADINNNSVYTDQEDSFSANHNNSAELSCSSDGNEVKESQASSCISEKVIETPFSSGSKLSGSNASVEFRKAFSYTRIPTRASSVSQESSPAISKTKAVDYSASDATPESSISEDDENTDVKCSRLTAYTSKKKSQCPTLPPLKRSFMKVGYPFIKRSPKITPYLPVKQHDVPTKTNKCTPMKTNKFTLLNCSCRQTSPAGWWSHQMNPSKQIGDYILIFPFNEASQEASSSKQINSKAVIDEVKKVIQKMTHLARNSTKSKTLVEDEKEKLDLNKPFWGFSSLFNN